MVSFMGPENASAQQVQYLFVPKPNEEPNNFSEMSFHRGLILTVTQFTHIPMADVFKVLQYWTFEPKKQVELSGESSNSTLVRMHVGIHYNKYTMLKSKILGGTKDDLVVFVQKWTKYVVMGVENARVSKQRRIKRRKSSIKSEAIVCPDVANTFYEEANKRFDGLELLLKEVIQQNKHFHSTALRIVAILCVVVVVQLLVIYWLWR